MWLQTFLEKASLPKLKYGFQFLYRNWSSVWKYGRMVTLTNPFQPFNHKSQFHFRFKEFSNRTWFRFPKAEETIFSFITTWKAKNVVQLEKACWPLALFLRVRIVCINLQGVFFLVNVSRSFDFKHN